jgi:phenylalanine-4-hydroxylase
MGAVGEKIQGGSIISSKQNSIYNDFKNQVGVRNDGSGFIL